MNIFLCLIAALAGLGITVYGTCILAKSAKAKSWPTAQGKIVDSRLRELRDSDGSSYEAYILYEYWVDGVAHQSNVWRLGVGSSSFTGSAKKAIARYPIGASVMVYFNPDRPADAMLEPGKASWAMFCFGLISFIVGMNAFLHLLK